MCDESTFSVPEATLTRRGFTAAAGAVALWPGLVEAKSGQALAERDVMIKTPDGEADAFFVHPAKGKHPAVLIWPDIWGLRPGFREMARRLARSGYAVLVVNPFYRTARAPVVGDAEKGTAEGFAKVRPLASKLSPATNATDARALFAFLDLQKSVNAKRKAGTIGYCMGGAMTMRTAAELPARIGAGCSFHGGGLATNAPDSPHLLVPRMKAHYLVAVADNDDQKDPGEKDRVRAAFAAAGLPAEIEVYKGAMHGWCPPDSRAYNEAQAERAWGRMLALFTKSLV